MLDDAALVDTLESARLHRRTVGFAVREERPITVAFDDGWGFTLSACMDRRTGETVRFALNRDQLRNLCHDILDVAWDDRT